MEKKNKFSYDTKPAATIVLAQVSISFLQCLPLAFNETTQPILFNLAFLLWIVAVLCVSVLTGSPAILNAPLTSFPRQELSCQIIYFTVYFRQEQDALLTASLTLCTDLRIGSQRTTFELLCLRCVATSLCPTTPHLNSSLGMTLILIPLNFNPKNSREEGKHD